jgi:hypothetical protein
MAIERPAESRFYTIINKMAADDVNLEAILRSVTVSPKRAQTTEKHRNLRP